MSKLTSNYNRQRGSTKTSHNQVNKMSRKMEELQGNHDERPFQSIKGFFHIHFEDKVRFSGIRSS